MLNEVKSALGITGDYQDATLQIYIDEVIAFLRDAGVAESNITSGIVARGVSDLWNYGSGEGKLSQYFVQRAIQLSKQGGASSSSGGGGGGDLSNYYTKMETDALLLLKANVDDVYTKAAIDEFLQAKQDKFGDISGDYVVTEKGIVFTGKLPVADSNPTQQGELTTKSYVDGAIAEHHDSTKANASDVYAKNEIDTLLDSKVKRATAKWLNDNTDSLEDIGEIYQCTTTEYNFTQGYFYIKRTDQHAFPYWGRVNVQSLDELQFYYTKSDVDDLLEGKLNEPLSGLAVGKYFRIASIDAYGHAVLECVDAPTAPVQSVSAAGNALMPDSNGNVNIPIPDEVVGKAGVVRTSFANGIQTVDTQGSLRLVYASDTNINNRAQSRHIISPYNLDYAVKAAMCDGVGAAWTDAQRLAALLRMGCTVDENGFVKFTSQE